VSDFKKDREAAISAVSLLGAFAKATAQQLLGASPELPAAAAAALAQLGLTGQTAAGVDGGGGGDATSSSSAAEVAAAAVAGEDTARGEVVEGEGAAAAVQKLKEVYDELQQELERRVVLPEAERAALRRALERAFDTAAAQVGFAWSGLVWVGLHRSG